MTGMPDHECCQDDWHGEMLAWLCRCDRRLHTWMAKVLDCSVARAVRSLRFSMSASDRASLSFRSST